MFQRPCVSRVGPGTRTLTVQYREMTRQHTHVLSNLYGSANMMYLNYTSLGLGLVEVAQSIQMHTSTDFGVFRGTLKIPLYLGENRGIPT